MVEQLAFGPEQGPKVVVKKSSTVLDPRAQWFVPKWDESITMDQEICRAVALGEKLDRPLLLVGPTGCGKTSTLRNMARLLNRPCRRINLFGDIRSGDLLGEKTIEIDPASGQSTIVWRDGVITDCKRNGYWLILDELDACPPAVAFVLQSLLESGHPLVLAANGGEVVEQEVEGPGMRIFATANTVGRGDGAGVYTGTNVLNEAFLDRFMTVRVDYLGRSHEVDLLAGMMGRHGGPVAVKVVDFACMVRAGAAKGETTATLSTRKLVAWAEVAQEFVVKDDQAGLWSALKASYPLVIADKLPPEDREYFSGISSRVLGWK